MVLTQVEMECLKEYLPLPLSFDSMMQFGSLDLSEQFFVPTPEFFSHEITFTAKAKQDAIRILLAHSNAKLNLLDSNRKTI